MIKTFLEVAASVSALPFLFVAFIDGSWVTALGAPVCVFLFRFAKRYAYNVASIEHVRSALEALQSVKRDFNLSRLSASQYVDSQVMSFLQFQGASVELIFTDPVDNENKILSSLRAYRDLDESGTSLIFVGRSSTRFSGARKFLLLHEVGHFTPDNYLLAGALHGRWTQALLLVGPSLILLWGAPGAALVAILASTLVAVWLTSWTGSLELSADSFAAVALVRSDGKEFALKALRGMSDQFRRIGSSINLQDVRRSREFFNRSVNMDRICEEVHLGNTMDFFGFGTVHQWRVHPVYFAVSGMKIALGLLVLVMVLIWGREVSLYQIGLLVSFAFLVSLLVARHEWHLVQIREALANEIDQIRVME